MRPSFRVWTPAGEATFRGIARSLMIAAAPRWCKVRGYPEASAALAGHGPALPPCGVQVAPGHARRIEHRPKENRLRSRTSKAISLLGSGGRI
ncbi:hypothetical protein SMJ63A_40160 [Stenotrophomonas geniculata]